MALAHPGDREYLGARAGDDMSSIEACALAIS